MRSIIPAAAVLLVALAATPAGTQTSSDAAGTTCAQFLKARAGDAIYRQASNWLHGYASGFNAGLRAVKQPAVLNLANDQLLKSATEYCQANPQATIANAASAWIPLAPLPPPEAEAPSLGRGRFIDLDARPNNPGGRR
jgi:hypothetical protein